MIDIQNMKEDELRLLMNSLLEKYDKLLIEAEKIAFSLKDTRETIEKINKKLNG